MHLSINTYQGSQSLGPFGVAIKSKWYCISRGGGCAKGWIGSPWTMLWVLKLVNNYQHIVHCCGLRHHDDDTWGGNDCIVSGGGYALGMGRALSKHYNPCIIKGAHCCRCWQQLGQYLGANSMYGKWVVNSMCLRSLHVVGPLTNHLVVEWH